MKVISSSDTTMNWQQLEITKIGRIQLSFSGFTFTLSLSENNESVKYTIDEMHFLNCTQGQR